MKPVSIAVFILLVIAIIQFADCVENTAKGSSLLNMLKQKEFDQFDTDDNDITGDQIEALYAKLKSTRIGRELLRKELDGYIHQKFYSYLVKEYEKEFSNHDRNTRGFEALGR